MVVDSAGRSSDRAGNSKKRTACDAALSPNHAREGKGAKEFNGDENCEDDNNEAGDKTPYDKEFPFLLASSSKERKAVIKAQKAVRKMETGTQKVTGTGGLFVEYKATDDNDNLKDISLLKIFSEIRTIIPGATARHSAKGTIIINVPKADMLDQAKAFTSIGGIPVLLIEQEFNLWGRIIGVNRQFKDEEIKEALADQGVLEVKREFYYVKNINDQGQSEKVKRNTDRVRLRFENTIAPEVNLCFENFRVQLCVNPPLQCLCCYKFNHRMDKCSKKETPLCRRCGQLGHQLWECTNSPKCINCNGHHCATDKRCPVYETWAKHARESHLDKVVSFLPDARIEVIPAVSPQIRQEGDSPTFSQVVGAPTSYKVIKTGKNGDKIVCFLPKEPIIAAPKQREKQKSTKSSTIKENQKSLDEDGKSTVKLKKAKGVVTALWVLAKPFLQNLQDKYPELSQLIEALEASGLISDLMGVLSESDQQ